MQQQQNLGWLFYKGYYWDNQNGSVRYDEVDKKKDGEHNEKVFSIPNKALFEAKWDENSPNYYIQTDHCLSFFTTYPGLLIGTGYNHETGCKGEIKNGFYFDYTTGMPTISGSSVKGTLRSAFKHPKYIQALLKAHFSIEKDLLDIEKLTFHIFEGADTNSMYEHDVFHDAVFTKGNAQGNIIGDDYITPHGDDLLKNPIPLQFLKILPGLELTFYFDLKDNAILSAQQKLKLFQLILEDIGIGAKTNVGYGHLQPKNNVIPIKKNKHSAQIAKNPKTDMSNEVSNNEPSFYNKKLNYKKPPTLNGEIVKSGRPNQVKLYLSEDNMPIFDLSGYRNPIDAGKKILVQIELNKKGKILRASFKGFKS